MKLNYLTPNRLYILTQLRQAGRSDPLFEEASYSVLHQLSNGLPRKINNLCLSAMKFAHIERRQKIDGDLILKIAPEALG